MVHNEGKLGAVRRVVTHYGHQGPKEIGTPPEFFGWLSDPAKNGAGALYDFGCYGANFATWLFDNARPLSVSAVTKTNKPAIYPRVDDEATIVLQYPSAQVVIQPSWNWPFSRKDMEIYGETGYLITSNPRDYRLRLKGEKQDVALTAGPLTHGDQDVIQYLTDVVRSGRKPDGLTGLANNLIVTEILAAARESARTGRVLHFK
jgi:predicted dehydrogenase